VRDYWRGYSSVEHGSVERSRWAVGVFVSVAEYGDDGGGGDAAVLVRLFLFLNLSPFSLY